MKRSWYFMYLCLVFVFVIISYNLRLNDAIVVSAEFPLEVCNGAPCEDANGNKYGTFGIGEYYRDCCAVAVDDRGKKCSSGC